jgi:hypothetical protein
MVVLLSVVSSKGQELKMPEVERFEGEFWLPDNSDEKIHGDCVFLDNGRIELHLRGTFGDPWSGVLAEGADSYDRIIGRNATRYLTLEGCKQANGTTTHIGGVHTGPVVRKVMSVSRAYDGADFGSGEAARFFKAAIQVENLQMISGLNGITESHMLNEDQTGFRGLQISFETATLGPEPFAMGAISINDRYVYQAPSPSERVVRQHNEVVLEFNAPATASEIVRYATCLRDAVALATRRASDIISIHLFHEDAKTETKNGDLFTPIRYHWNQVRPSVEIDRSHKGFDPLFTIPSLGGVGTLGKLIMVLHRYEFANARIMSTIQNPPDYLEIKTMLRLFPLEAVFTEWSGPKPTAVEDYKSKLAFLVNQAGTPMQEVLDHHVQSWTNAAKSARNLEGHSNPAKFGDQFQNLYLHSEVALLLYTMVMLREAGAPAAAFDVLTRSSYYARLQYTLKSTPWTTIDIDVREPALRRLQSGTATVHVDRSRDELQNAVVGDVICFRHGSETALARLTGEIRRYRTADLAGDTAVRELGQSHAEAVSVAQSLGTVRKVEITPIKSFP